MKKRVLICANPDLNFIDGSSIWAQTITLAVSATSTAQVEFLAKSKPERDELFGPLKIDHNITIVDGSDPKYWGGKIYRRINLKMMAELAIRLDQTNPYDVVIVRGLEVASHLLDSPGVLAKCWMYLTDIPQAFTEYTPEQILTMQRIAEGCNLLLCQSDGFMKLWKKLVPKIDRNKLKIYSPVIPDLPANLIPLSDRPSRIVYAGKFKGDWLTLEMAEYWRDIYPQIAGAELVMIGDKIHDEPLRPEYKQLMLDALQKTEGLRWLGALSREAVQEQLRQARVGLSWRDESMNDTVEYSTKILEYGGAGCAAILNRNALHEKLLGKDYPLYANSGAEFIQQLIRVFRDPLVVDEAASALRKLADQHTFSKRVIQIREWLADISTHATLKKIKVLVAGHDLKFFDLLQKNLEATGRFIFLTDQWQGHNKHNEEQSRVLLDQADVIFCEWCMGNLKWYSNNKKPHQRLVARFHLQERELPYVRDSNWNSIDHISYVSEFIRREGQNAFGFPIEKTSVIGNLLDENKFTTKKKNNDARYTLGIIGVTPARKRLDLALDLLEMLLSIDSRYCLRVKGKHPLDYAWLLKRSDELDYYEKIFNRINNSEKLRYKVIFDPPGDDVNEWFSMVGYILSTSDFESFHMAIGEGVLTGAKPIIWNWDGADEIWSSKFCVSSVSEAVNLVQEEQLIDEYRSFVINNYSSKIIARSWMNLIESIL